jgi:hypothetical protein
MASGQPVIEETSEGYLVTLEPHSGEYVWTHGSAEECWA